MLSNMILEVESAVTLVICHFIKYATVFVISVILSEEIDLSRNGKERQTVKAMVNAVIAMALPVLAAWLCSLNIITGLKLYAPISRC